MYSINEQEENLKLIAYPELLAKDNLRPFNEVSSVVFFICDLRESQILFVSTSSEEVLGHHADQLMSSGIKGFISLIHPEDYPVLLSQYADKLLAIKASRTSCNKSQCLTTCFRVSHGMGHWVGLEADLILLSFDANMNPQKIFGNLKLSGAEFPRSLYHTDNDHAGRFNESHLYDREIHLNLKEPPGDKVSKRELEVLKLIANGFSAKQIADKLFISIHTAINHRKNLINKFKVKNTAELIYQASKIYWF